MSITHSQATRLGIFVTGAVVLLALFIVVPMGFKLQHKEKRFFAYFIGESISGLENGANVKFHGVPIGKVDRISYNPRNLQQVRIEMKVADEFPLKVDMYAQTGAMGITGLKYVEILGGTDTAALRLAGTEVPTKQSMIASITGKAEVLVGKIELLLNHINLLTDPDSLKSIKVTLDNVAEITTTTREFIGDAQPRLIQLTRSVGDIVTDLDTVAQSVKIFSNGLNKTVSGTQVYSIMGRIDSTAQSLNSLAKNLDNTLKQSKEDFRVSMENLREAMENANQLSQTVAENPSLLLRSEQKQRDAK